VLWPAFVQWTGPSPAQDPNNWDTITYKYDPAGRRIKKKVDNYTIRYIYDGGNVIGEYDGNNNLTRKYIHGARVDELVCMIDVVDSNAVYYYHYDATGSVVALSDSDGDSCQSYEYSVYGQTAVSDPNFIANPYMFTGRRFDYETGLYYYRARYYNPYIGRFLQTDPIGYSAGMNLYAYCGNNPLSFVDPLGLEKYGVSINCESLANPSVDLLISYEELPDDFNDPCNGYDFIVDCNSEAELFTVIDALIDLGGLPTGRDLLRETSQQGITIKVDYSRGRNYYTHTTNTVTFNPRKLFTGNGSEDWMHRPIYIGLAHELIHAYHDVVLGTIPLEWSKFTRAREEAETMGIKLTVAWYDRIDIDIRVYDYRNLWITDNKIRQEAGVALHPDQVIPIER